MAKDKRIQPPADRKPEDTVYKASKAITSLIPGVSAAFELLVKDPMSHRLGAWAKLITEEVNTIRKELNLEIEAFISNPRFISAIAHASTIAIKNHQQEKITALANAVVNSVILDRNDTDEYLDLIFIRYVDELTPLHVRLLAFFMSLGKKLAAIKSYPELFELVKVEKEFHSKVKRDEFILVVNDLAGKGLIRISQDIEDFEGLYQSSTLSLERTDDSLPRIMVTDIGKRFTDFISKSG